VGVPVCDCGGRVMFKRCGFTLEFKEPTERVPCLLSEHSVKSPHLFQTSDGRYWRTTNGGCGWVGRLDEAGKGKMV
jgi:hypothetical protein